MPRTKEELDKLARAVVLEQLHPAFIEWAEENSINLMAREDYGDWYRCWASGYNTAVQERYQPHEDLNG